MRVVDRNFKSFYALIEKAKEGNYQFKQIRMPHYLPKEGYFSLIIPRISIKNGSFAIPMSRAFKKEHGELRFNIPPNLEDKEICEVRIHPRNKGRFFEIEYIYEQQEIKVELNANKYMSVDFGLDNLATCVTNEGASMILDGKSLKSYNRLYNKINANIQSSKDKSGIKGFNRRQVFNVRKRNRRVNHAMSVAASKIIKYCLKNQIGNLIVGYNLDWKRNIEIGKVNNQNFVQIPHGLLRQKLKYQCELYGVKYIEQEESYTSKASFFDNDELPTYNADNPQQYQFSGKRISRGQYRIKSGYVLNADVNGALNILRKSKLIDLSVLQDRGCVNQPQRISLFA